MRGLRSLRRQQRGSTLAEVLVALALAAILLPALLTALVTAKAGRPQTAQQLQATSLVKEAQEAVRVVRERGWSFVATDGTYYPAISGTTWGLTSGTQTINGFTRQIVISSVQRNSSDVIVTSGGTVDPSTKKVVITVSWSLPYSSSMSTESYLTRWQNNTSWTQTTQADFTGGTQSNAAVTNNSGGEVELASWTGPATVASGDITGTTDANDVFMDTATNRAYVVNGTGLNIFDVTDPTNISLLGTYNAAAVINGVYVVGNFAYLASANDSAELTIVNVTTPATPTLAGSLNIGNTEDATSVFVTGGFAYVGKLFANGANRPEFTIVNVSNPAAPTQSGTLDLTGDITGIYVSGNFAYVSTAITTAELTIVNVTTKTAPTSAGTYNSAGTAGASDVFAVGTTVYLAEPNNTGGAELFILNAATPTAVTLLGSYEAGAAINGVYVSGNYAFIATAITSRQFSVLNIATPATISVVGNTNLGVTTNDVFVSSNAAYVASTSDTAELTVIGRYQPSGTQTSSTFNASATASYNYLNFTATTPTSSTLKLQIATNNDNATWNYVGPDGTASTFYTSAGAIPFNTLSGQYVRYQASLSGNRVVTPVLSDVTLTYSP